MGPIVLVKVGVGDRMTVVGLGLAVRVETLVTVDVSV